MGNKTQNLVVRGPGLRESIGILVTQSMARFFFKDRVNQVCSMSKYCYLLLHRSSSMSLLPQLAGTLQGYQSNKGGKGHNSVKEVGP